MGKMVRGTYVEHVHELSDIPAETGHKPPRQHCSNNPQYRVLSHVLNPVSSPFDGVDAAALEVFGRLLDQAGGAGEGKLSDDLGGESPECIVRVDAAALAQAQDLPLHDLILVVDKVLELEHAGPGEHGVQQLAPLAVELRVVQPEDALEGVEGIVVPRVFEVLGALAVDGLVEADIVEMELVGPDPKSTCVCQSVSRSVEYETRARDFDLLYSLCSFSNTFSGYAPFSVAILCSQSLEIAASRGPENFARGWKCTR